MINLVLADDHPFFLEGFLSVVSTRFEDIRIAGLATNGEEAVEAFRTHRPDVTVLDIRMPVKSGIEAAKEIRQIDPEAKIMILTTFDEQHLIEELFAYGINGYVLKETPLEEVIMDIRLVHSGQTAMNNLIMQKLYHRNDPEMDLLSREAERGEERKIAAHPQLKDLGIRERQIFKLILRGRNNTEIAETLNLSDGTVRNYVHSIYNAIDVHKRSAVIIWAMEEGIV